MSLFRASQICLSLGSRTLFEELNLTIEPGECVGILGVNGSGKSTLLKIVAGLIKPDSGILERMRGTRFTFLPQDPVFAPEETIASALFQPAGDLKLAIQEHGNVAAELAAAPKSCQEALMEKLSELADRVERLGGWETAHHVKAMLQRLGVPETDWERPLCQLSGGQRKRAAIVRALQEKPDLLILDEPTNHLDAGAVEWLEAELDEFKGAILLVTHDRYFLDRLAEKIVELSRSKLTAYPGNFSAYLEQKLARQEEEARQEHKRQRLIAQEIAWLRTGPRARRTKRKSRVDAARALIAQKAPPVEKSAAIKIEAPAASGHRILEARHIFQGYGDRELIRDFSLILEKGERIGIVGSNGAGKTTLLKTLLGLIKPKSGDVVFGKHMKAVLFDQHRESLDPNETVYESMGPAESFEIGGKRVELKSYLEDLLFPIPMQRMKVGALSGGEKGRLQLARLFLSGANLLVLDEPTNDLDLTTLEILEEKLLECGAAILLVTHDRYFLDKIATSIIALDGSGQAVLYRGNYETYLRLSAQKTAQDSAFQQQQAAGDQKKAMAPPRHTLRRSDLPPEERTLTLPEWKRLESMEVLICAAEEKKSRIETALADPELYTSRITEVPELQRALDACSCEIEALYAEWELLEKRSKLG